MPKASAFAESCGTAPLQAPPLSSPPPLPSASAVATQTATAAKSQGAVKARTDGEAATGGGAALLSGINSESLHFTRPKSGNRLPPERLDKRR